jgi:hypothetical protein
VGLGILKTGPQERSDKNKGKCLRLEIDNAESEYGRIKTQIRRQKQHGGDAHIIRQIPVMNHNIGNPIQHADMAYHAGYKPKKETCSPAMNVFKRIDQRRQCNPRHDPRTKYWKGKKKENTR